MNGQGGENERPDRMTLRAVLASDIRRGQSLVEVLIAIAVGIIMVIGAITAIVPALRNQGGTVRLQVAVGLGKELMDTTRVFAESDWHNISALSTSSASHYYLNSTSSPFSVRAGDESVVVGTTTYVRYFSVDEVWRDSNGMIVSSGGTLDPSTRKVTVAYSWIGRPTSSMVTYFTRSRSYSYVQTDWSGGSGQEGPLTTVNNKYASSTGIDAMTTPGSMQIDF
ncbi:MAG: hypothetical protein RL681_144 [Candidatus Parcubacteria bacterium]|jgi:Tfp pilus assembly protein PilV